MPDPWVEIRFLEVANPLTGQKGIVKNFINGGANFCQSGVNLAPFLQAVARYIVEQRKALIMLLSARNIQKTYVTADGPFAVLRGVDLMLEAGETLALTGESGSGKSTLLHVIGGLDVVDTGTVMIDGADITAMDDAARAKMRRGVVGVIFQQFNLIPSLTVAANIAFQARLSGTFDAAWVAALVDRLGLGAQMTKYPEQLSGGQQQRVAIARSLAPRPRLVLADEPTGNLDEDTAASVMQVMRDLVAETGAGLLMVTHSTALASQLDRRVLLRAGQIA